MRLHVHEWGDPAAPAVICLHGVAAHGARFRRLAERLPGRRVLAFDLRGHGRSNWSPPWNTATHVDDVLGTAAALDVERCDWIGFSFGGRIAAALADGAPERVGRLCLLDPALALPAAICLEHAEMERSETTFADPEEAIAELLDSGTLFSTPREMLEEEMREHLVRRDDGRFEYRYLRSVVVAAFGELALRPPPAAAVPTLVVRGERSWVEVDVDRYREALGHDLRTATVPGGHAVLWDAFEETAGAVAGFLGLAPQQAAQPAAAGGTPAAEQDAAAEAEGREAGRDQARPRQ
jgi:lipase